MSFENEIPFGVKASNLSSVASFASTLDDSYILVIANNCNDIVDNGNSYDFVYNDVTNGAIFGANSTSNHEAYIGVKINDINHKIAFFNSNLAHIGVDTAISGNIYPSSSNSYNIGSETHPWNNLYLSEHLYSQFLHGDGSGITNINIGDISLDKIKQGTKNKAIVNNVYDDNLMIDGGLNVKFLMINGVLFANSNDDIQSLFYSNLNFGNSAGNNSSINADDINIKGTIEVDNVIANNNISVINNSKNGVSCIDIANYTPNPSINVKQVGNGDVLKISNDYQHVFTMNKYGFIGNKIDPKYEIDISGTIKGSRFIGDGLNITNINISDRSTTQLKEGVNLYFTDERVYDILYSSKYFASNQFIPYIDTHVDNIEKQVYNFEENITDKFDKLREAYYGISLDKIKQGTSNQYIINNIFNDSMIINGTLKVRNIELIEAFDTNISSIYQEGLYNTINAYSNYDFGSGRLLGSNVSNIVYGIISNISLDDISSIKNHITNTNKIISDDITYIKNDILDTRTEVNELYTIVENLDINYDTVLVSNIVYDILKRKDYEKQLNEVEGNIIEIIEKFKEAFYNLSLDKIYQGTSNKYIIDNIYDNSMIINGTLSVQNVRTYDTESITTDIKDIYKKGLYNTSNSASNYDFGIGSMTSITGINYEAQINNVYELMSYEFEKEKTILSNRINSQENEINILKYNIDLLEVKLQNAINNITTLQTSIS